MILFSDLHLQEKSEEVVMEEVLPGIYEASKQHKDPHIAFLGDFFHLRYTISVRLLNAVRDELRRWTSGGATVTLLPGNHDQIDVQGRNALESFGDIDGVVVHTEPTVNEHGLWLPYRKSHDELRAALNMEMPKGTPPVLFMHHGVFGSMMNDHIANTDGLQMDEFFKFKKVFTGHYHKRQVLDWVTYIGSPWQTKADEAGQPKGYAIWDGKELEFVDTNWGPKFHRFELEPGEELDLTGVDPRDEVRVFTKGEGSKKAAEQLGQLLHAKGLRHVCTPEIEANEQRLQVSVGSDLRTYAKAYVEQMTTELDKDRLMKTFEGIVS